MKGGCAPYTTLAGSAQAAGRFEMLQVKPFEKSQSDQSDANQIDRNHPIEQARHNQDENSCDERHNRWDVGSRDGHEISPVRSLWEIESRLTFYRPRRLLDRRRTGLRAVPT